MKKTLIEPDTHTPKLSDEKKQKQKKTKEKSDFVIVSRKKKAILNIKRTTSQFLQITRSQSILAAQYITSFKYSK